MGSKLAMRELWTGEPTNTKINNSGTPNAHPGEKNDPK
jgi:hypothetical protein